MNGKNLRTESANSFPSGTPDSAMKPAWSIIVFTVLSGFGLGLSGVSADMSATPACGPGGIDPKKIRRNGAE